MKTKNKRFIKECELKLLKLRDLYRKTVISDFKRYSSKEASETSFATQMVSTSSAIRQKMKDTLPEIERALIKIKQGTYGMCELTGEEIDLKRLRAVPWARVNIQT